jgi:opacity protein-like surface antigen
MKRELMKKMSVLFLVYSMAFICIVKPASAAEIAEKHPRYIALKGGLFSPTKIRNYNDDDTTIDLDTQNGYGGELAIGHYPINSLAMEFEAGYFEIKNSTKSAKQFGDIKLKVYPVLVTTKVFIPMGLVEPFGEFGIGVYITKTDANGNQPEWPTSTSYEFHAGGGLNLNLTDTFFLGAEWRYIWARQPESADNFENFKLDGYTATGVLGFRF